MRLDWGTGFWNVPYTDHGRIFPFEGTSPSANSNQTVLVPLLSYIVPCMEVEVELFVLYKYFIHRILFGLACKLNLKRSQ